MRGWVLTALLVFAPPVAAATLQEQYNAAQVAFDNGDMAAARAGFAAVLLRLDANPKTKLQAALVRARMGAAANALAEPDEAATLITAALPAMVPSSHEWTVAMLDLALAQELALDYVASAATYRSVLAATQEPGPRLSATLGAARTLMFSEPQAARGYADTALGLGEAAFTDSRKGDSFAQVLALRGRIDLNDGHPADARAWLEKAVRTAGGVGSGKISVADVRVRGDLALAAFQSGDATAARKYLAYTGAGQLQDKGFEIGADTPMPPCSPAGLAQRDDMVIVDFAIGGDGRVTSATPVFTTRRNGPELEFARTVRSWSWRPEVAAKLPAFWRQSVRIEMRCMAGTGRGIDGWQVFKSSYQAWSNRLAVMPLADAAESDAGALPILRLELARREAKFGDRSPQLAPALMGLLGNAVLPDADRTAAGTRLRAIVAANGGDSDLITYIDYQIANRIEGRPSWSAATRIGIDRYVAILKRLDDSNQSQSLGAAFVAVEAGVLAERNRDASLASKFYRRVASTPPASLPESSPVRQRALFQLASIEARASRLDSARAMIAATGLNSDQCALADVTPILSSTSLSMADFPREAQQWGMDGYVRLAFDIEPDGRTSSVRTVLAIPPVVFNAASEAAARRMRYKPIFRGDARVGCRDYSRAARFIFPG